MDYKKSNITMGVGLYEQMNTDHTYKYDSSTKPLDVNQLEQLMRNMTVANDTKRPFHLFTGDEGAKAFDAGLQQLYIEERVFSLFPIYNVKDGTRLPQNTITSETIETIYEYIEGLEELRE